LADQPVTDAEPISFRRTDHVCRRGYGLQPLAQYRSTMRKLAIQFEECEVSFVVLVNAPNHSHALPIGEGRPDSLGITHHVPSGNCNVILQCDNATSHEPLPSL